MSDKTPRMGDAYSQYPTGSPEHYAGYKECFDAKMGFGFPFPDDLRASYEADNAAEAACESHYEGNGYVEDCYWGESLDRTPYAFDADPDFYDAEPEAE
jgi:hypothetical protein